MRKNVDYNRFGIILGIIGIFIMPMVFGVIALSFGIIARSRDKKKNGAIIIGLIDIILWSLYLTIGFTFRSFMFG